MKKKDPCISWLRYSGEDSEKDKAECDRKFRRTAFLCSAALIVLFAAAWLNSAPKKSLSESLSRPEYGEAAEWAETELVIAYAGEELRENLNIKIQPEKLSEPEAEKLFDLCEAALEKIIPGESAGLREISTDLVLPSSWGGGRVSIAWDSGSDELISDGGKLFPIGNRGKAEVELRAVLSAGDFTRDSLFNLTVLPEKADMKVALKRKAMEVAKLAGADEEGERLKLPDSSGGASLLWNSPRARPPVVFVPLLILILFALFNSRYDSLKKRDLERKLALEEEIPNMTLRLTLLLNAGLVVSSALDELVDETRDDPNPLYRLMRDIKRRCDSTNDSFASAFYRYAVSTGEKDLIRITAFIYENSGRGCELAEKLEGERDRLWFERLNRAKTKAGEAETKLCLPLMLLLMVLVVISIAPSLMEM